MLRRPKKTEDEHCPAKALILSSDSCSKWAIGVFSQDYVSAIKLYQSALSRHYFNKDSVVLLYLARAHYDSDNLAESKRTLLKAIHVAPTGASQKTVTSSRDQIITLCGIQSCSGYQHTGKMCIIRGMGSGG